MEFSGAEGRALRGAQAKVLEMLEGGLVPVLLSLVRPAGLLTGHHDASSFADAEQVAEERRLSAGASRGGEDCCLCMCTVVVCA